MTWNLFCTCWTSREARVTNLPASLLEERETQSLEPKRTTTPVCSGWNPNNHPLLPLSHFIEEIPKPFSWYWFFSTNRLGIFEHSCFISQLYPWRRNRNFIFVMRSCQSNIDSSPKSNTGTSICRSKPRGSWESKMKWQQQEGPRGRTVWTKMLTRYWVGRHKMKTVSSYMTNSPTGIQCMNLHGRRVFGAAAAAAAASWQRIERNSTWCLQTVEEVLHWRGPVFHRGGV